MRLHRILFVVVVLGFIGFTLRKGSIDPGPSGDAQFEAAINTPTEFVLVKFGAEWCGPCRAMEPQLDILQKKMGSRLTIAKVDTDDEPGLAQHYRVSAIPKIVLFKEGQVVDEMVGGMDAGNLQRWIEQPRAQVEKKPTEASEARFLPWSKWDRVMKAVLSFVFAR